ncbi:putative ubiquitin conjugation factor E4 [Platanthera guangdongensis]|uniref:Ubiquitin conjugation factor E4 n=1 Tax=Platanthera guangdongensis TaxID=2320717 RepID=A0ABR2LJK0_9ASPA
MERVLIDRLSGIFPSAKPPFPYLIGSFRRSVDESRRVLSMNDLFVFPKIESAIKQAKRLLVSYCRIHVGNLDMFAVGKPTTSELLDLIFHVSALPDHKDFSSSPDVGQYYFLEASIRRPADRLSSFTTIKTVTNILYNGLGEVILSFLKNIDTKEKVLDYLAAMIAKNSARSHMQVDPLSCANTGLFVNLSTIMLRLSRPFLDSNTTKRDKIDPKYVFFNHRLDLRSFICECFVMTARVLNLGLMKALSDFKHIAQELAVFEDLSSFKAMREQGATPQHI